jgi:hypothetical protein
MDSRAYYPVNGKVRSDKKAIIIISIIALVLLGLWGASLFIMHNHQTGLFKKYQRPPLPEQKGKAQKLPATDSTLIVDTSPGSVMHMGGNVITRPDDVQARLASQSESEIQWWNSQPVPKYPTQQNKVSQNNVPTSISNITSNINSMHPAHLELLYSL